METARNGSNGTGNRNLPGSSDPHVQEVVRAAHEELRQLMRQRADVMKRIGTVKQTIVGLANLFGDAVLSEELLELVDRKSGGRQPGFTKACRMVLMESDVSAGGSRSVRENSAAYPSGLAPAQRSSGFGHDGPEPPGGIRRGSDRGSGERPQGMGVGRGSSRQRISQPAAADFRPRACSFVWRGRPRPRRPLGDLEPGPAKLSR